LRRILELESAMYKLVIRPYTHQLWAARAV